MVVPRIVSAIARFPAVPVMFSSDHLSVTSSSTVRMPEWPSASSATDSGTRHMEGQTSLRMVSRELSIAQRILGVLKECPDSFCEDYLDRLEATLDLLDANLPRLSQQGGYLSSRLAGARQELLDLAPNPRIWTKLARAVDPDARLRLPARFVGRARLPVATLDLEQIASEAWVRGQNF